MADTSTTGRRLSRPAFRRAADRVVTQLIGLSGIAAIVILAAITVFLVINSSRALREVGLWNMVSGTDWFPTSEHAKFGFLPAEVGSLWVTAVAMVLCIPVGVAAAIYISEFAGRRTKEVTKSIIEFMAAVPSVVLALLGIALLAPHVREWFNLDTGLTAFTAGIVVGAMALPTIITISEDALHAVPKDLRTGSLALGNTQWQTVYKVVLPSASSGIFAAVMLGLGRAIGETMVVLILAGNSGIIPDTALVSARTMPGTIAGEMAEVVQGGLHYSVLFAMGLVLFTVTFAINLAADIVLERQRKKWRR
ncbi:MAG: phosphate ABC transporter permease subunit PstC [Actinobacteria bacterium HGW-Actinobacteria-7]|jgi:phosphate transport system permease protein|nr:MAG: phosphate ABC transporter permease subunit PstC [Actinobacteria bacterium HGW-Actinobacteria-7]